MWTRGSFYWASQVRALLVSIVGIGVLFAGLPDASHGSVRPLSHTTPNSESDGSDETCVNPEALTQLERALPRLALEKEHWVSELSSLAEVRALLRSQGAAPGKEAASEAGASYEASADEIDQVFEYLENVGSPTTRHQVEISSSTWSVELDVDQRAYRAVQVAAILIPATVGAIEGLVSYYWDHKVHDEPFTCVGASKATIGGAILGAAAPAFQVAGYALRLKYLNEIGSKAGMFLNSVPDDLAADVVLQMFNRTLGFDVKVPELAEGISTLNEFFGALNDLLVDAVTAGPGLRGLIVLWCSAGGVLADLVAGRSVSFRTFVRDEFIPNFEEAFGVQLLEMSIGLDAVVAAEEAEPAEVRYVSGALKTRNQAGTHEKVLFNPNEVASWSTDAYVSTPGAYRADVILFRDGEDSLGVSASDTASVGGEGSINFSGTFNTADLYEGQGAGEGLHHFQVSLVNTTQGWAEWLRDGRGDIARFPIEMRNNSRPSVTIEVLGMELNLPVVTLIIVDPDGERPQQVSFEIDGSVEDWTGALPAVGASGVNWAEGYSLQLPPRHLSTGIYSIQAAVSDSGDTVTSGPPQELRVGGFAQLDLPAVVLSEVGRRHQLAVRLRDNVGGLPNRPVYLYSAQEGRFYGETGESTRRAVTDLNGWATFEYKPLEEGQHRLEVHSPAAVPDVVVRTSNGVLPACSPPEGLRLLSPSDQKANVGEEVEIEWRTADGASSYDIFLGPTNPPPFRTSVSAQEVFGQEMIVGNLTPGTQYFWKVVARAACSGAERAESAVRSFFTLGSPGGVELVKPLDGASDLTTALVLDWENVTTPGSTTYWLFLGETPAPPFFADTEGRSQVLVELEANRTYFWRVEAVANFDPSLTATSATWQFETGGAASQTVELSATMDAGLRGGAFSNRNYGGGIGGPAEEWFFGVGSGDALFQDLGKEPIRGVVQFDLSSVPAGVNITHASLRLISAEWNNPISTSTEMFFDPFLSPWSEESITWSSRPQVSLADRVEGIFPPSGWAPLDTNVTPLVQKWASGALANNGLLFSVPDWESTTNRWASFTQKERDASGLWAATLAVTYTLPCSAPPAPQLVGPLDGATNVEGSVTLEWDGEGASDFLVYVGTSPGPTQSSLVNGSSLDIEVDPLTTYHWRVEALSECDASLSSSSPERSFSTGGCVAPDEPLLTSPSPDAQGVARRPVLQWEPAANASEYDVRLGTSNPPTQVVATSVTTSQIIPALQPANTYYWQVTARTTCGDQPERSTPVRAFVTGTPPRLEQVSRRLLVFGSSVELGAHIAVEGGLQPFEYAWTIVSGAENAFLEAAGSHNPILWPSRDGVFEVRVLTTDANGFISNTGQIEVLVPMFGDDFESADTDRWSSSKGG